MKSLLSVRGAFIAVMLIAAIGVSAKEKIAVAEPRTAGISTEGLAGISDYLESKLGGDYDIFSRASLRRFCSSVCCCRYAPAD